MVSQYLTNIHLSCANNGQPLSNHHTFNGQPVLNQYTKVLGYHYQTGLCIMVSYWLYSGLYRFATIGPVQVPRANNTNTWDTGMTVLDRTWHNNYTAKTGTGPP